MNLPSIVLKPGREKSVLLKHPWIFASAIREARGNPQAGETVTVLDASERFLATAAFSPKSQIAARVWSWLEGEQIDQEFFEKKICASIDFRKQVIQSSEATSYRLIHAESDFLPGLIVDRYNDNLVTQILSAGAEFHKEVILDSLVKLSGCNTIYERSDVDVRGLEGLQQRSGIARGRISDGDIVIEENGQKFFVDIVSGQKTGFYLDQRENRKKIHKYGNGKDVLNCFSYTGGFSVYTLSGGAASVLSLDSSEIALQRLQENIKLNQLPNEKSEIMEADVFKALRLFRDQARSFDLIVLDPPKFAPTVAQAERATRGYKDINLLALKLLRPGGILFTFSCSGGISRDLFQKIVTGAAADANVDLRIIEQLSQSPDHPVLASFPESFYLKGLICMI